MTGGCKNRRGRPSDLNPSIESPSYPSLGPLVSLCFSLLKKKRLLLNLLNLCSSLAWLALRVLVHLSPPQTGNFDNVGWGQSNRLRRSQPSSPSAAALKHGTTTCMGKDPEADNGI